FGFEDTFAFPDAYMDFRFLFDRHGEVNKAATRRNFGHTGFVMRARRAVGQFAVRKKNVPGMNAAVAAGFAPIGLLEIALAINFDHLHLPRHEAAWVSLKKRHR
ncbi:MAG: hypothetical protein WB869_03780, partial [Candidatus Acidiferrales bacterium]